MVPSAGLGIGVYRYALDERHADNSRWANQLCGAPKLLAKLCDRGGEVET